MNITVEFDVSATMRDGIVLRANVYRPVGPGHYSVLLTRLPYGKDTETLNLVNPLRLAASGYIVVVQDCRGRYQSDGVFGGYEQEFEDGYDTVQWAAQLPCANGRVGMFGTSYYGFTQWAAAIMNPPALHCIAPVFTFDSQWNGAALQGGAYDWGKTALWYLQDIAPNEIKRLDLNEPERNAALQEIYDAVDKMDVDGYWTLPLMDLQPLKRLCVARGLFEQFDHPTCDGYWSDVSLHPHYQNIHVPSLNVAGWYDIFVSGSIQNFQEMKKLGVPSYLLIGPWSHMNRTSTVGELCFPHIADVFSLDGKEDFTNLHQRWFDAHLKDDTEAFMDESPVKVYVMGANRWRHAGEWPLPETTYVPFYLQGDGNADVSVGKGNLSEAKPVSSSQSDRYVYDPLHPVPTVGGSTLLHPAYPPGPMDQQAIEKRPDMLVYTSKVLDHPIEVTGPVKVRLYVSSSASDTDFVARLTDVFPDGKSICLCDGILRVRFHDSWNHPELMNSGEIYEIEFDCGATSNVFQVGHCIRLDITSSNFPRWNRNLNTGGSNEFSAQTRLAEQMVYHDEQRPSHVLLPIIPT